MVKCAIKLSFNKKKPIGLFSIHKHENSSNESESYADKNVKWKLESECGINSGTGVEQLPIISIKNSV